jgi:hypothetical protein
MPKSKQFKHSLEAGHIPNSNETILPTGARADWPADAEKNKIIIVVILSMKMLK